MEIAPYQILEWDSRFFGRAVARIHSPSISDQLLVSTIRRMKTVGLELVYWPSERKVADELTGSLGGIMVDEKLTFCMNPGAAEVEGVLVQGDVEPYQNTMPLAELEALAVASGGLSRFQTDPRISRSHADELYRIWLRNSVNGTMADAVLVVTDGTCVVGFVTLKGRDDGGRIELLAVDPAHRGRGHGLRLVQAAEEWCRERGFTKLRVVTQATNGPACGLYRKAGFQLERTQYFYHFWL